MLSFIGLFVVLRVLVNLITSVVLPWFRTSNSSSNLPQRFGKWAIVTGATDGIGKAIAIELASKGMNLLLISRTASKLDLVEKEIHESYQGIKIKTLQVDCSKLGEPSIRRRVKETLDTIHDGGIGLLINNVGMSYDYPQYYAELSDASVEKVLQLNIESATWMTKLVLPLMEERKAGAIVNTSSASAHLSCPLLSQYGATKKYLEHFSLCLAAEYKDKGISVQCYTPCFVTTKMSKIRKPSFFTPTPSKYAKYAVANIGCGTLTVPYPPHALQLYFVEMVPDFIAAKIMTSMHLSVRSRALKKLSQKKD